MDARDRKEADESARRMREDEEKQRQIKEAEKYLRSGRQMPEPEQRGDQEMSGDAAPVQNSQAAGSREQATAHHGDVPRSVESSGRGRMRQNVDVSQGDASGSAESSTRGRNRQSDDDDGGQPNKATCIEEVRVGGGDQDRMTDDELCKCINNEFPDLAQAWSEEFPELRREGEGRQC